MVFRLRKLNKNNNGIYILICALVFGAFLFGINYYLVDFSQTYDMEEYIQNAMDDKKSQMENESLVTKFLNFLGKLNPMTWGLQSAQNYAEENSPTGSWGIFSFFTLDYIWMGTIGVIGDILKYVYWTSIFIGIVDIIWIG